MSEMNNLVKVEDINPVKKKFSFDVPWTDVKQELDSAYRTVGKKAKIKGFRPGKIPRKVLETHFKDEAEGEAITNMVNRYYWNAVEHSKVIPVAQPAIDQKGIENDKNFTFTATVEIRPTIEPRDYIGLEIEKEEPEVTETDVQGRLETLREMYSTLEELKEDRGAKEGDYVTLDFEGRINGTVRSDMKAENYVLEIGSKRFVPGFEEQLVGARAGEPKEIQVTFPEDYHAADIAGKEVVFSVNVKEVKEKIIPALDEGFVKNLDKYESLDDVRADIRRTLEEEKKAGTQEAVTKALIDKLFENNPLDVPEAIVERQIYAMMLDAQRRMTMNGMEPRKAAEIAARMRDRLKGDAERMVKTSLLLESIAEKESIQVDETDLEKRIRDMASRFGQPYEDVKKAYEKEDMRESLELEVREQKTLDFIEGKAKINTVVKKAGRDE